MGGYIWCTRNKANCCTSWNSHVHRPHEEVQGKHYTLMDLPVHGEQIKSICQSWVLIDYLDAYYLFSV